jgi:hypothetical protein
MRFYQTVHVTAVNYTPNTSVGDKEKGTKDLLTEKQ